MQDRFISEIGGYLPILRLDRTSAAKALIFSGLGGRAVGRRAVAGWDEDALTLAVEAARGLTPADRFVFASTSAPFFDRSHATLAAAALGLPETTRTNDVSGSRRCAVSAVLEALLGSGETIVAAGERRVTRPGSAQQLSYGDGGAAIRVGGRGGAKLIGHGSVSHDLLDSYTSRESPTPYVYEERFVRETAGGKVIVPAISAALAAAGIEGSAVTHAAVHEPLTNMWRDIARPLGITVANYAEVLAANAGDLGAAHAIYSLALAFAVTKPGDIVLLAGFGSGCDALLFEMTGAVAGADTAAAMLTHGTATQDYIRFLSLTGSLDLDFGVRAEFEQKAQGTVVERHGRDTIGFVGGRDSTGNVQFPKTSIPVRPGFNAPEPLVDVPLADCSAKVASVTADRLNYTPDPPFWFGLVQFDNSARVLMEMTDANPEGFAVGDPLTMRFRIKSVDRRRGFRTYFWKAAPEARPSLEN